MRTILTAAIVFSLSTPLLAQDPEFIRIVRDDDGKVIALETAVVRYEKGKGADQIILEGIGAIHIADKRYYETLNKRFKAYDVLCYELVAKKGTRPPKSDGLDLYGMMGTLLDLESQMAGIDYSPANFVHADMSLAEMRKKMGERGESPFTLFLKGIRESLGKGSKEGEKENSVPLTKMLTSPVYLKRKLAEDSISSSSGSGLAPTMERYIVKDRNEVAMKIVDEQFRAGKKNVGLFYGAAHFPDFHKRLIARGFRPTKTTWIRAWDLSDPRPWDVGGLLKKLFRGRK